jgi:hypothetical protein
MGFLGQGRPDSRVADYGRSLAPHPHHTAAKYNAKLLYRRAAKAKTETTKRQT